MTTPAKAEATKVRPAFTFDGVKYSVDNTMDWDLEVLEAVEDDKIVSIVRALLGPDQWAKFKAKPRKVADLNDLFQAIAKAVGLQGNS
jgi:hypothetical protein